MGTKIAIAAAIAMACAALGISLGQGWLAGKAMDGMSKQPEKAGEIRTGMIVAMAIMETIGVLTFVIAIMLVGKI